MFKALDDHPKINQAVAIANIMLKNGDLSKIALEKHTYDMSNATGSDISSFIKKRSGETVYVGIVWPKWRFTKMRAVFYPATPDRFFINGYKIKSYLVESMVGTIIHEHQHYLDHKEKDYTFGHGSNSAKGKENTAPYYIGRRAKKICQEKHFRTPINKKRVKWYNPLTWF